MTSSHRLYLITRQIDRPIERSTHGELNNEWKGAEPSENRDTVERGDSSQTISLVSMTTSSTLYESYRLSPVNGGMSFEVYTENRLI